MYFRILPLISLFSLCCLHYSTSLLHAQGFGVTGDELAKPARISAVQKALRNHDFMRPSERYNKEIILPFNSLSFENGAQLHSLDNMQLVGHFDKKNRSVSGVFDIPKKGSFSLELIHRTYSSNPSPFVISLGNKTYDWQIDNIPAFHAKVFESIVITSGELPLTITQQEDAGSSLDISSIRLIPTTIPADQLVLRAETAKLQANSLARSSKKNIPTLHKFKNTRSAATWEMHITEPGLYALEIDYQSKGDSPKKFSLSFPSHQFFWNAEPTQGQFMTKTVGVIEINKGTHNISLQPEEVLDGNDLDVLLVSLAPISYADSTLIKNNLPGASGVSKEPVKETPPDRKITPPESKEDAPQAPDPDKSSPAEPSPFPPPYNTIKKDYNLKIKELKTKYINSQKRIQQKFSAAEKYPSVVAIQELLNSPDAITIPPSGLPKESSKLVTIYTQQKSKLEKQIKQTYLQSLYAQQAQYAKEKKFNELASIQKFVIVTEALPSDTLFSSQYQWTVPDILLVGTWELVESKKIKPYITISIDPDGKCIRLHNGSCPGGSWGKGVIVEKKDNNEFIFSNPSAGGWLGQFHFLNNDTFDMPWKEKSEIYQRIKHE